MDKETRKRLEGLSEDELRELITRLHGREEAVDREIVAFATRQAPAAHLQELRQWVRNLTNRRGFVSYRQSFEVAQEVGDLVAELEVLVQDGDPTSALALVDELLRGGGAVMEGTDDSSGLVSGHFRDIPAHWLRAARRCRDAGQEEDWVGRVEGLMVDNGHGLLDTLLPQAAILLSEPELRELARRYEAGASKAASADYASFTASTKLGLLAWALRDPSVYVRSVRLHSPEPNELQMASIVECYLDLEDPQGALEWLSQPWPRNDLRRLELRARAFVALGKSGEWVATRRQIWERQPCVATLEKLLAPLAQDEKNRLKAAAIDRASTIPGMPTALELLLHLERPAAAEQLLLDRRSELDGDLYGGLDSLARQFEATGHPLASSLIHRALLDSILRRGYSRAYHHAARYYRHLTKLAKGVTDWRDVDNHGAYVADLWRQQKRKTSFWSRVGGGPG